MSRRIPDDCTVRLIDLPAGVGGRISEAPDGHVDIYINARYGENGCRRALDHELDHYDRGDLDNDLPIEAVEGRAAEPVAAPAAHAARGRRRPRRLYL